jgi:hypothetical protein
MDVVCDVALCSLVDIDRRFRAAYCFRHQGTLMTETGIFIVVDVRT